MGTIEDDLFDYDLGFGEQQLFPNSQVITSSSQTSRDFPKQTPLSSTMEEHLSREVWAKLIKNSINPLVLANVIAGISLITSSL